MKRMAVQTQATSKPLFRFKGFEVNLNSKRNARFEMVGLP